MFRSMPLSTWRVCPMCWKDLCRSSMMTSASATLRLLFVANAIDRAQSARGTGRIQGGEGGDREGADRHEQVVQGLDGHRELGDVVDLGIQPHAEGLEAVHGDEARDHAEHGAHPA